ncbi:helix-turn-helix transcriptional regulator [Ruminococcus sp.]|uniref:helix-turn-helix domain-containing protein n=1 Tax=Ruminococcus sp. TaxID=41978 RepID=UPI0025F629D9|nr:helix-turn-helix transcriptional regulator [Ruminococcus sp.]
MADVRKLKGKIVEKGETISRVAKGIGVNPATFYRKLQQNGEMFTIREADAIVRYLGLNEDEAVSIFFSSDVA